MNQEKAHSQYGPSSAERWMNCAGSIALIAKAPPAQTSKYAEEGTEAHGWLEFILRSEILGEKVKRPKKVSIEMENFVQDAVNWVRENYMPELGDILQVESKVSLDWIHPDMFGTLDIAIIRPGGRLTIVDFKYGAGKVVEPDENAQLICYALPVARAYDFDFEDVELVVIQPRATHSKGPVRSWVCEMPVLRTWEVLLQKAIKRVTSPNAKLFAGDHCQFCPAIPICPALQSKAVETAQAVFSDDIVDPSKLPALPDPKDLSPEVVGQVLTSARALETWVKGVYAYAEGLLERGGKIEGFKLVNKQPRRKWINEIESRKHYFDMHGIDAFDLKSPRQLEGLGADVGVDCISVSSGTTIVPESDKRPAIDNIREVFNQPIEGEENGKKESEKENGKKESRKKGKGKKESRAETGPGELDYVDLGF